MILVLPHCNFAENKSYMLKIAVQWSCVVVACLSLVTACRNQSPQEISAGAFEKEVEGKSAALYTLDNGKGMKARISNYGGRLVSLLVPDRMGELRDVVLGFDSLSGYMKSTEPYFGAIVGRYANRIAKGRFKIGQDTFRLSINNGPNTLHGGLNGFQYRLFSASPRGDSSLVLNYVSKDGEEGFPGNLRVRVQYTLTAYNELKLNYQAVSDKNTVINLSNHAFFNLNGAGSGTVNKHLLRIFADFYTPVDSTLIPSGQISPVEGSPFDFRKARAIGERLAEANVQLRYGKGYDHNFVLSSKKLWKEAAIVKGDQSGIMMTVYTTEPGLQFYGGNFMQSRNKMRGVKSDDFRTAFCLETQHFPDSPNQPDFPSTLLKAGQIYKSTSVYRFSTE